MTLARMAAIPVTIDRRNQPPMPLNEYVSREMRKFGRELSIISAVFVASLALLVLGGVR